MGPTGCIKIFFDFCCGLLSIFPISTVCLLAISVAKWSHSDKKTGIQCIFRTSAPYSLPGCTSAELMYGVYGVGEVAAQSRHVCVRVE